MTQMSYLHSKGTVLKYLTPQSIIATRGFDPEQEIELQIVDLAVI